MSKEVYSETNRDVLKRINKRTYLKHKLNIRVVISVVLIAISSFVLYFGFNKHNSYSITKIEKGITDYKVYMNKDDIYKKDYQNSGFSYVSSTIDYVKANFNYELKFNKDVKTKYDYEIKSNLVIKEPGVDGKVLYTEEYQELSLKTGEPDIKDLFINEDFKIDYKKYNLVVENYKKKYGVSADASVKTTMYIKEKSMFDNKEVFNEVRELSTTIPLGEHTLTINVNNPINIVEELKGNKEIKVNVVVLIIGIIVLIIAIMYVLKTMILLVKYEKLKTAYDIKLAKILKEYDRIIVETDSAKIDQKFKNIISVNEFEELVDVRDNTEQPILYVERKVGRRSDFMVINDTTLYVYDFNIENMK